MSRWFRHYAGMMRDDKLVSAAIRSKQPVERVVWVWGAILESASEINDDGLYRLDCAEVAYFLRADEADIRSVLDALADAGRVAEGRVVKWGDRQFKSDQSAERQARYRDKKRAEVRDGDDQQTLGDGGVTLQSQLSDAPETDTELEEETEKNISLESERDFVAWYEAFPRHVGKGAARKAYRAARKKASPEQLMLGALRAASEFANVEERFVPYPATWLNAERWLDGATTGKATGYDWNSDPANRGVL